MGSEPVEVLRGVVDRMEAPEERDSMLNTMPPVDKKVAQYDDLQNLQPNRLRCHRLSKSGRYELAQVASSPLNSTEDQSRPKQVLPQEKQQVRPPMRTKEALAFLGWEEQLQRSKQEDEKAEANGCPQYC